MQQYIKHDVTYPLHINLYMSLILYHFQNINNNNQSKIEIISMHNV